MKYQANPVIVEAFKIVDVGQTDGNGDSPCALENGENVLATPQIKARHHPLVGDYWVNQDDGNRCPIPKAIFERRYSPAPGIMNKMVSVFRKNTTPSGSNGLNFDQAVEGLKAGKAMSRAGWNGKGMYIKLQNPDTYSLMTLPYVYMKTADGNLVPWLASQSDLLAEDWMSVVHEDETEAA